MISIIVPVYNVEKYLDQAVRSVLGQTYPDWELLLINDGSSDGSPTVCRKYEKMDRRIRVFDKENGGVSSARNMGRKDRYGLLELLGKCRSVSETESSYQSFLYQRG